MKSSGFHGSAFLALFAAASFAAALLSCARAIGAPCTHASTAHPTLRINPKPSHLLCILLVPNGNVRPFVPCDSARRRDSIVYLTLVGKGVPRRTPHRMAIRN